VNSLPTIPLFPAGQIVATPGALALLEGAHKSPLEFLSRHLRGDWGDLCRDDKTENELGLKNGFRLMSSYHGRRKALDHHGSGSLTNYVTSSN
jgi:hypothetical protein